MNWRLSPIGVRLGSSKVLLLLTLVVLLFSNGRWAWAPAAWLAPLLLLRYTRQASLTGFSMAFLLLWVTWGISWFGLIPFPPLVFLQLSLTSALLALIPFLADRWVAPRLPGGVSTLVFPAAAVGTTFLNTFFTSSTWGLISYTQASFLPLLQLASVFGVWGIAFLIYWTASTLNWVWDRRSSGDPVGRTALVYSLVLAVVILSGIIRLSSTEPEAGNLPVATTNPLELLGRVTPEHLQALQSFYMGRDFDVQLLAEIQQLVAESNQELLSRTRSRLSGSTRLFFWPEAALIAFSRSEEAELLGQARELAREKKVYLGVSVALLRAEESNENKVALIDPRGEVVHEYHKTYLVPFVEEPYTRKGTGDIRSVLVDGARVGMVICYDMDIPGYLAGAGRERVDVLFAPSGDWEAIQDLHHSMAVFRAVEQGFNLVRPANHGLSAVVDYKGRVLARMDHFQEAEGVLIGEVPLKGVATIYNRIGDLFAWLILGLLSVLLLVSWVRQGWAHGAAVRVSR